MMSVKEISGSLSSPNLICPAVKHHDVSDAGAGEWTVGVLFWSGLCLRTLFNKAKGLLPFTLIVYGNTEIAEGLQKAEGKNDGEEQRPQRHFKGDGQEHGHARLCVPFQPIERFEYCVHDFTSKSFGLNTPLLKSDRFRFSPIWQIIALTGEDIPALNQPTHADVLIERIGIQTTPASRIKYIAPYVVGQLNINALLDLICFRMSFKRLQRAFRITTILGLPNIVRPTRRTLRKQFIKPINCFHVHPEALRIFKVEEALGTD